MSLLNEGAAKRSNMQALVASYLPAFINKINNFYATRFLDNLKLSFIDSFNLSNSKSISNKNGTLFLYKMRKYVNSFLPLREECKTCLSIRCFEKEIVQYYPTYCQNMESVLPMLTLCLLTSIDVTQMPRLAT